MLSRRREFLGWLGGTSALAAAGIPIGLRAPAAAHVAHPASLDDKWDLTWADRVQAAKFRAVFDSPAISDGDALFRAMVWCDEYKAVYATPRADMAPVLVFRHQGIALAMDDGFWKRFDIGKEHKVLTPEGKKWAEANPIYQPPANPSPDFPSYSLKQYLADGGIVLACDFAFALVVERYKKDDSKLNDASARAEAIKALIPGVILQPSGVFAVLRAQEAGCKYIIAS
jgi:hypothetical protein